MRALPAPLRFAARYALRPSEGVKWGKFLGTRLSAEAFSDRWNLMNQFYEISDKVHCAHTQFEMISVVEGILSVPKSVPGCIVEAGCFKGGSAAKFSLVAQMIDRKVVLFDSFEGMPENDEAHDKNIFGESAADAFAKGTYRGALAEVQETLSRYGCVDRCEFHKGWFDDTMPHFNEPVAAAYIDVDLASSTRTCLKFLYPLLVKGGVLYSQDGHLPLVIEVFRDAEFWQREIGIPVPHVEGLGTRKLIKLVKH